MSHFGFKHGALANNEQQAMNNRKITSLSVKLSLYTLKIKSIYLEV